MDFAKIPRNIVDFRVNGDIHVSNKLINTFYELSYKQPITAVRSFKSLLSENHLKKINLFEKYDYHFEAYLTIK